MGKLILKMDLSVDGFVGGPNGESDWIFATSDDGSTIWELEALKLVSSSAFPGGATAKILTRER